MIQSNPPTKPDTTETDFHAAEANAVLAELAASDGGLSRDEAEERLRRHGENRLKPPRARGPLARFLAQFHNVLIYVLIGAAAVTALLGHWLDTAVILGVVVINAVIGMVQEGKAERALDAIRDMLSPKALVLRDGHRREIPAEQLVPGDIVQLQSGDRVPADMRLLRVRELRVDEAVLTGESVPVEKHPDPVAADAVLGDRLCMAFSSTLVRSGQATGVVTATGEQTEIGHISGMLAEVETLATPLLRQIGTFGRLLAVAILVLATLTFLFGWFLRDYAVGELFLAAVGLAVAAIPEGLPALMTITLAIGVQRMAGRRAIIRRLPAVETLGAVTVICSDKTGTLTRNEMTARRVVTADTDCRVSGVGYAPDGELEGELTTAFRQLLTAGVLCNDATLEHRDGEWILHGDPTEGALLTLGMKAELDHAGLHRDRPRLDAIPFESEHRFMASLNQDNEGQAWVSVKGAPERLLDMCSHEQHGEERRSLQRDAWLQRMEEMAAEGQRVLALAVREVDVKQSGLQFDDVEQGLTLLGLVGIIDPPRDEAINAVALCQQAGIRVKMITGDHALTARAIGAELGIGDGERVSTGQDIEGLGEEELRRLVAETDVFARASPEHKLRLVKALQARGEVVAMTGDGVNDAPALKRADVGVAMGMKGTEVSKEASEMVLADDNFASIARAVEEGRTVYDNLRKALLFLLPTNGGQAGVIIVAVLAGMVLPITPVQILWVNMVTAVTLGLALAFEPTESGVMQRPPRPPAEPILSRFLLWRVAFVSGLLVLFTFIMFHLLHPGGDEVELARTAAVNTLVVCQAFYLLSARYLADPAWQRGAIASNPWVPGAIAGILALQLLFTYAPPLQILFGTMPLPASTWGVMLLAGFSVLLLVEVEKAWFRRRGSRPDTRESTTNVPRDCSG
ncbi:cation-transporting P-type ATPase [Methylonatrum kenyense]|uniref:cation-transporting P-type ATPase n=1 Tax=Methylonatrum kenyense TaxID=455253 RepID=UPI0020BECFAD|nr:cation-transporting P-type ATPase [Methylonatrum kenyense]MCK8516711.1 cation-transporting P-type ATPase [Methylonatrum kenyense]